MATYTMSDLHGHMKEFERMLELIGFSENDHLYILGDIVDKGPDSIPLLLKIMDMKNVTCLLGNHDHMMYTYLKREKEPIFIDGDSYCHSWFYGNGGNETYSYYRDLPKKEKEEIYEFLKNLYVCIPTVVVNDKKFYLVHSLPSGSYRKPVKMNKTGDSLYDVHDYIWERHTRAKYWWHKIRNKTVIAGHTMNGSGRIRTPLPGLYDIDCGCAANDTLGCLRLDDMAEFYVECEGEKLW